MEKFTTLTSIAAALPLVNIDTDMIIPKQFLKTIKRTGLGQALFYEMRFDLNDKEIPDFVLNKAEFRHAKILVARDNFGCGSSREHAPWALADFGIYSVIAPSFADIFYNNCFKNSILPIILPHDQIDELLEFAKAENNNFTIDLPNQELRAGNKIYKFEIDPFKKHCLIEGLDDIGLTLQKENKISDFESKNRQETPWLYN
ncbi:MAG: 3-isopropylmalate dehydratase small subunit [Alphaproteobacteria bacterium RIFCSPLOWO2_01_FULL_40_26]|nr:MAG: 3-isopropylmalate dehydratase small subunit [Alphaproteobacteria bacterium RIFCSPHIGHO2_02_FULL_40_34]OFW94747.1 MAG: 3-isopropylmalate dehydratase small subunit [Alphaproteobacteria bacterium RIFCSPLOWO2_01_FULL_40_26]OFX10380.1 MAG: 3-isopropylmalate dehydratase small subunit [Alphaproteobacteria bacterium RIFCSPLOWO2_02_FULL_40_19]OFX12048.1 MAG: 3-isopropylmalate dehydratase small subunit [Alphaproteobacteria bacterium RIFCSPLOWO2_12_FULL_40_11]